MLKILVVDDDVDLLDVTTYALRREGFNTIVATDGQAALERWQRDQPDVIVADVRMPNLDGLQLCHHIRQSSSVPIILLTAANSEEEIIQGFQVGADDYVVKPFSPRQLSMRIRAVWRRGAASGLPEPTTEVQVGEFTLDVESHEVTYRNDQIQLTPIEFKLLHILAVNSGRTVVASRLVDYAWGYDGGDVFLLKTHISHIRKKLRFPRGGIRDIRSIPHVGYRLMTDSTVATSQN